MSGLTLKLEGKGLSVKVFYRRKLVQHPDELRNMAQEYLLHYGMGCQDCLVVDYISRLLFSSGCWVKVSREQVGLNLLEVPNWVK